ncbi:hypothetical protein COX00_01975 [Candidatus Uhrbacteria bacterium CG22_combo_CG10-13_8_21_14_all_47_17]|uniref:Ribosomal RNA large subunit methyltransferase K/L-like methyltransferase domain-containing protein n=1 Tax=Candidatus Uhrbacteria bacterium CG22_combo_CG10-13_8_21_14_all_47_17 TaxID=1975041 RepID=A0A2H0BSQ1_9BACT|nr:MAG: hypothetical protein COX00_01975 [Candidatus Uhrbacteria bacterium CG22_combo_CG10-13_8_21_14_all_47_17]
MKHFLLLGSQPRLSLAEAHAVIDGPSPMRYDALAVFSSGFWDDVFFQNRLAGTVKLGDIETEVPIGELTPALLADIIEAHPRADRILFGLSIYGAKKKEAQTLKNLPIQLKRELKTRGKSVRWVTGDEGKISPAAVAKLHLTTEGYDFMIGIADGKALIGLTTQVQDADAWSKRDFGRPFRDAKTGMLPPKLARMMVNLAVGLEPIEDATLLDPFCGSGTVIMEAALLFPSLKLVGADIDTKQIAGSQENFKWLVQQNLLPEESLQRITWRVHPAKDLAAHMEGGPIRYIVTEGFLGRPLQGNESIKELESRMQEVKNIWEASLPALAALQPQGGRLVCTWPTYKLSEGLINLEMDDIEDLGYRILDPLIDWSANQEPILYTRPDQHLARRIVVLERI